MPQPNSAAQQGLVGLNKQREVPTLGSKILLSFYAYGQMHEVTDGSFMLPNGTYIEVEVKSVKTAKLVLE